MHQKRRVGRVQHVRASSAASKAERHKEGPALPEKRSRATASRRGRLGVWGTTRRQRPVAQSAWAMAMVDGRGVTLLTFLVRYGFLPLAH
jgi:hypothetical protein